MQKTALFPSANAEKLASHFLYADGTSRFLFGGLSASDSSATEIHFPLTQSAGGCSSGRGTAAGSSTSHLVGEHHICLQHLLCSYSTSAQDGLHGNIFRQQPYSLSANPSKADRSNQAIVSSSASHYHSFYSPGWWVLLHLHPKITFSLIILLSFPSCSPVMALYSCVVF